MVLQSTEYVSISSDLESQIGPEIPDPLAGHCFVKLDDSWALFIGGILIQTPSQKVFIYAIDQQLWSNDIPMPSPRYFHTCGVLKQNDVNTVVVVGGRDNDLVLDSTIIYKEGKWTEGPKLEGRLFLAASVVSFDKKALFIFGGCGYTSKVYIDECLPLFILKETSQIECLDEDCTLKKLAVSMEPPRYGSRAVLAQDISLLPPPES